jgi:hypothetical protein
MRAYWFVVSVLTVWRLTHLFVAEDGPWQFSVRLRRWAGDGFWGTLLDCFQCLSLWISVPMAAWLGETWIERAVLWLALSGGAILAERLSTVRESAHAQYVEDSEADSEAQVKGTDHDGMLRQGTAERHDEAGITEHAFTRGTSDSETGAGPPEQRVL